MSKMDNLRAMREARYAANSARAGSGGSDTAKAPAPAAKRPRLPVAPEPAAPARDETGQAAGDELCGHRNMGGRSCTREKGHTAKSHRYS